MLAKEHPVDVRSAPSAPASYPPLAALEDQTHSEIVNLLLRIEFEIQTMLIETAQRQ
jgi:hypothetical protein